MNELWFNANLPSTPDSEENQDGNIDAVSTPIDTGNTMSKATSQVDSQVTYDNNLLPSIAEGGRDWSTYPNGGLPAINNPDSSEFDPNAEGSRDALGRVRWGSKDWDVYNSNKSSGDSLSQGVTFGGGGGFGGGGQSVSVGSPMTSLAGLGAQKKFPWLLAGGVLVAAGYYFMVYKK